MMLKFQARIVLFFFVFCPFPSFAQSGNVGNGGGGGEPTFIHLRSLLIQWIELGALSIDISQSLKKVDWDEIVHAMKTIPVQFDPSEVLVVGNSKERACKNDPTVKPEFRKIECNLNLWNRIAKEEQLAMVFHEYLGILGYEPNSGDFSNYPLSSQLLGIFDDSSESISRKLELHSIDLNSARTLPSEILEFAKSQLTEKSTLEVAINGVLALTASKTFYKGTVIKGAFLKSGDYILKIQPYQSLRGTIGRETFKIKQSRCPMFQVTLIWNSQIGIRSIRTETECFDGDFVGGFQKHTARIKKDGGVSIENKVVSVKKRTTPIVIRLNGVKYKNLYIKTSDARRMP